MKLAKKARLRFDRHAGRWMIMYPERGLALNESGALRPDRLIERVVDLDEAARMLPTFDRAAPAGMTMIDPQRG